MSGASVAYANQVTLGANRPFGTQSRATASMGRALHPADNDYFLYTCIQRSLVYRNVS